MSLHRLVRAEAPHQFDPVVARRNGQHICADAFRKLQGDVPDPAARAEDHQLFAGFEVEVVIEAAQGRGAVRPQGARGV
jgi:hypothetical protein